MTLMLILSPRCCAAAFALAARGGFFCMLHGKSNAKWLAWMWVWAGINPGLRLFFALRAQGWGWLGVAVLVPLFGVFGLCAGIRVTLACFKRRPCAGRHLLFFAAAKK
ncbi:hypothetical protein, partial [Paraburkholderia caribensis]|uniref:hypothetical protein n=1 Tax=Paraburkholderia caribensis TaxID=75105 RepID=UPI002869FDA1